MAEVAGPFERAPHCQRARLRLAMDFANFHFLNAVVLAAGRAGRCGAAVYWVANLSCRCGAQATFELMFDSNPI